LKINPLEHKPKEDFLRRHRFRVASAEQRVTGYAQTVFPVELFAVFQLQNPG